MVEHRERVILVPGASGALGAAVVDKFLETGAMVVGVARTWKPADVGKRSDRFLAIQADLGTPAGARLAIDKTIERAKRIDAVVHTMGGFAGGKNVAETDDETWDRMMDINARSAFYVFRAALPHVLNAKSGRIIAVGSRAAVEPAATLSAYSASKAALVSLVRTIALEVVRTGVTANVVLPSVIDTPQNRASDPSADFSTWVEPNAIADLILYLASEAARDVNGAAIPIYGGA